MTGEAIPVRAGRPSLADWVETAMVGPRELRDLFGTFLTGVTVVTAYDQDGSPRGFTANSFTSVSLEPPLILVCVANSGNSSAAMRSASRFAIHILTEGQRDISAAFASGSGAKFKAVEIWSNADGPPLIADCFSTLDCERQRILEAGDHMIVIGRVMGFRAGGGRPLGYYRGGYLTPDLGAAALEKQGDAILIGCLVESDDRVLLVQRLSDHDWRLPATPLRHGEDHRLVLPKLLARLGIKAEASFLYSAFQEPGDPHTMMVFRGAATGVPIDSPVADGWRLRLFSERDEPWDLVTGSSQAEMLKRFFRERTSARFGIYWDTGDGGRVATVVGTPLRWSRRSAVTNP